MPDMLVKLYVLKNDWGFLQEQESVGITIRKPIGPEKLLVTRWIEEHFSDRWASEFDKAMSTPTVTCFIAVCDQKPIGFACYDSTVLGFFGPTGVLEEHRGKGAGKALLLAALLDMKTKGYAYAVIGGAGPTDFYKKVVGAIEIPDSSPGIFEGMLRKD